MTTPLSLPPDPRKDLDRLKLVYDVYRDYMKHEDDLLNQRSTWNLIIQGFLFTALGALGQWQAPKGVDILRADREHLVFVFAALGIAIEVAAGISMQAAHCATESLLAKWDTQIRAEFDAEVWRLVPPIAGGGHGTAVEDGKLAARIIPFFIGGAWLLIGVLPFFS